MDSITLGMGGAADTLLITARSGDSGLLEEQVQALQSLTASLRSIAKDAVAGYDIYEWLACMVIFTPKS